jgi:hypothetical protein
MFSGLAIEFVHILPRICSWVVDIQTATQAARIYLHLQERTGIEEGVRNSSNRREERRPLQALGELEQGQERRRPTQ